VASFTPFAARPCWAHTSQIHGTAEASARDLNDWRGNAIEGYTFDQCKLFSGDSTAWRPTWSSGRKLNDLNGTAGDDV